MTTPFHVDEWLQNLQLPPIVLKFTSLILQHVRVIGFLFTCRVL